MTSPRPNGAAHPSPSGQPDPLPGTPPTAGLYREVVLVDRHSHAGKRVLPVTDWRIAAEMNAVFITGAEFPAAARELPIAFVPVGRGADGKPQVTAVVLTGLRERENLLVSAEGRWDAGFLPAFLRRYPFAYVRSEGERFSLAVDVAWPGFNDREGQPLLTEQHEPSAFLAEMMKFLDAFEEESARTRRFCDRLVELDLLRGGEINGQSADGQPVQAHGFFMVDEAKLRALPDEAVLELHRNGVLGLIHTHLVSMGHVEGLARRLNARH